MKSLWDEIGSTPTGGFDFIHAQHGFLHAVISSGTSRISLFPHYSRYGNM
jgi:hypothetical protein